MKAHFEGELDTRHLKKPVDKTKWFKTIAPFAYISEDGTRYDIPVGTCTDFASIPIGFRNIIARFGRHSPATLLHDWLCKYKIVSRKKADMLLREAMKVLGVGWLKRRTMYFGVRAYSITTFKK